MEFKFYDTKETAFYKTDIGNWSYMDTEWKDNSEESLF